MMRDGGAGCKRFGCHFWRGAGVALSVCRLNPDA